MIRTKSAAIPPLLNKHPRNKVVFFSCVVLLIGYFSHMVVFLSLPLIPTNDSLWYLNGTHAISQGGPFDLYAPGAPTERDIFYPIGYPLFLDMVHLVFGWKYFALGVLILQHVMSIGSAVLLYLLGNVMGRPFAGFLTGIAYALYFPAAHFAQALMSETTFVFVSLLAILCFMMWLSHHRDKLLCISGMLLGLAFLVRSAAAPALVVMAGAAFIVTKKDLALRMKRVLLIVVPVLVVNGAVFVHNGIWPGTESAGRHWINRVWGYDGVFVPEGENTAKIVRYCEESGIEHTIPGCWWDFLRALRVGSHLSASEADKLIARAAVETVSRYPRVYLRNSLSAFVPLFYSKDNDLPPLTLFIGREAYRFYLDVWSRVSAEPSAEYWLPPREFLKRQELVEKLGLGNTGFLIHQFRPILYLWSEYFPRYDGGFVWVALTSFIYLIWRRRAYGTVLFFFAVSFLLLPSLFEWPVGRYREPVMPLLLLAVMLAVCEALKAVGGQRR